MIAASLAAVRYPSTVDWNMSRLIIIGPGRAGGAVGLAALRAGHDLVGIQPGPSGRIPDGLAEVPVLNPDQPLPAADVCVVAVRDDAIGEVASALAPRVSSLGVACHLSGLTPVATLDPLAQAGVAIGSLHPLQTLPDPETGAASLPGAWAAITGSEPARTALWELAADLELRPFPLDDASKPAYHAGAAAAANYVVAALGQAEQLLRHAGVPFAAARPLVERIVANAFEMGPAAALTGPIARGDVGTVRAQLAAASEAGVDEPFRLMARATALQADVRSEFEEVLE